MTSLVLGDLIQDSLTPSVKAPLGSLKANSVQIFCAKDTYLDPDLVIPVYNICDLNFELTLL
jgi:hypothetical protein